MICYYLPLENWKVELTSTSLHFSEFISLSLNGENISHLSQFQEHLCRLSGSQRHLYVFISLWPQLIVSGKKIKPKRSDHLGQACSRASPYASHAWQNKVPP
jgi:hypothetical protein